MSASATTALPPVSLRSSDWWKAEEVLSDRPMWSPHDGSDRANTSDIMDPPSRRGTSHWLLLWHPQLVSFLFRCCYLFLGWLLRFITSHKCCWTWGVRTPKEPRRGCQDTTLPSWAFQCNNPAIVSVFHLKADRRKTGNEAMRFSDLLTLPCGHVSGGPAQSAWRATPPLENNRRK